MIKIFLINFVLNYLTERFCKTFTYIINGTEQECYKTRIFFGIFINPYITMFRRRYPENETFLDYHIPNINFSLVIKTGNGNENLPYDSRLVGNQPLSTFTWEGTTYNFSEKTKRYLDARKKPFRISKNTPPSRTFNCSIWFHHIFISGESRHWQVYLNHLDFPTL